MCWRPADITLTRSLGKIPERKPKKPSRACPSCGRKLEGDVKICYWCKSPVVRGRR